ncbi:glycerol kinase GlpK [Paenibacillus sp. HB172176]|uniref:glycerol kinase GlpK n=1 Tax=Paenibacillus sp. HB172176 TaxID=2493690 RepID=UPI00143C98D5|nr:glycerol kinase GlpK [Paenibacillus sp. HB172176]
MKESWLLTIDQSTSGTKALVITGGGRILSSSAMAHKQYYPSPGWVEHDAVEIYRNVLECAGEAVDKAGIGSEQLSAITLTNQRETALVWDRTTGEPLAPAIVWQCQRTSEACEQLKQAGHEPTVRARSGLLLDPYFSASKWRWLLDHAPCARQKLARGELLAGTIDSWLLWKLTGGAVHATDYTNASRTSLYNIHTLQWDDELCGLFGVPRELLPEARPSDAVYGYTRGAAPLADGIPIAGVIGDSQAALFGHLCLEEGMAKATYGTGTSVLMNTGAKPAAASKELVQAIAWGQGGTVTYAAEAIIRTSGDSIKWIRDDIGLFDSFDELDALLLQAPDNEGVYLVPAFVGLGAPYWQPNARAAIIGMNRGTGKAHLARAAVESIAYQVKDAVDMLQEATGIALGELRVDGGASSNDILMQFQADLLAINVIRAGAAELSALGSAYMGGLAVGLWSSLEELRLVAVQGAAFAPDMHPDERARHYAGWKHAVRAVIKSQA